VKILDEGPSDFHHKFTCKGCKAKLAAETNDVVVGYFGSNYGGDRPTREYYVECPRCGTDHKLDRNKIPMMVRQKADQKQQDGGFKE